MSDPGADTQDARLQASHDSRRVFQNRAYAAGLLIIIGAAVIILIGVAMKPPMACSTLVKTCVPAPDWGMAIVTKAQIGVPLISLLLGVLGGWVGGTLWRGANDVKASGQGGGQ